MVAKKFSAEKQARALFSEAGVIRAEYGFDFRTPIGSLVGHVKASSSFAEVYALKVSKDNGKAFGVALCKLLKPPLKDLVNERSFTFEGAPLEVFSDFIVFWCKSDGLYKPTLVDASGHVLPKDFKLTETSKIRLAGQIERRSRGDRLDLMTRAIQVIELAHGHERYFGSVQGGYVHRTDHKRKERGVC
jgi:hypothetical protein